MEIVSKMQNIMFVESYSVNAYNFCMAVIPNETATRKTLF